MIFGDKNISAVAAGEWNSVLNEAVNIDKLGLLC